METLLPWLAVAGLGALHGLSPASGWMFAAERGLRSRDEAQALRALAPMALGHATSVAIVVIAVAQGVLMDRTRVQVLAGALLVGVAAWRWMRGGHRPAAVVGARAGDAGIAIWSCLMSTAHGAGLMLVPALLPLCMSDSPAREITASGSVVLAVAAVGVHMAAMLVTTGAIASGICRGVVRHPGLLQGPALRHAWSATLAVTGVALLVLR
jgi:hypothetical protein